MQKYLNKNGNSPVVAYEIDNDSITIVFNETNKKGINTYIYNNFKPGLVKVYKLKELALAGRGLATYIVQEIKKDYDARYCRYTDINKIIYD